MQQVWSQVQQISLPWIIQGDFNQPVEDFDVWPAMAHVGSEHLGQAHPRLFGTPMPPTCNHVTQPDNAIVSHHFRECITGIEVCSTEWFATHQPVIYKLCIPVHGFHKVKYRQPRHLDDLQLTADELQAAQARVTDQPTTIEAWGEYFEKVVDAALHARRGQPGAICRLPKAYRGRCRKPSLIKCPFLAPVKDARHGEYTPAVECVTLPTRRKIKQLRRLSSFMYRVRKHWQQQAPPSLDMQKEWFTIVQDRAFGSDSPSFLAWIQDFPEVGPPLWPVPTCDWLHAVIQLVTHEVDACLHQDAIFRKQRLSYMRQVDKQASNKQAFKQVRGPTKPLANAIRAQVDIHGFATAHLDGFQVDVFGASEQLALLQVGFPATLNDQSCAILQVESHFVTVLCSESWVDTADPVLLKQTPIWTNPHDVGKQLTDFWGPIWMRDPPQMDPFDEATYPVLHSLPQYPPIDVRLDDLQLWKGAIRHLKPTARGVDFVSASDLKILPDAMIQSLCEVLTSYHDGYPQWFMTGITCAFSKTDSLPLVSATRPITILPQLYRLWAGVIFGEVSKSFAQIMPVGVTGMLPKRGASMAAYAAQANIELSRSLQTPLSGITLDIKRCFNAIARPAGHALLLRFGLPRSFVKQWYSSLCLLVRVWTIQDQLVSGPTSTTGFPEGDHWSVLVMLTLACLWVCHISSQGPPLAITCSAYADNWSWSTSNAALNGSLMQATLQVAAFASVTLDMSKTWYWTTSSSLVDIILGSLAAHGIDPPPQRLHEASDLGFQLQYSGNAKLGVIRTRYDKGLERLARLGAMPHDLSVKEHMALASVFPTAMHGVDIRPLSKANLSHLRSKTADALVGRSRTLSPVILLLCTSNDILDPEYWMLKRIILAARAYLLRATPDHVAAFLATASQFRGTVTQVRGPASALGYAVQQLDWTIDSTGVIHATAFDFFNLCHMSVRRITRLMTLAWQKDLIKTRTERYSWFAQPDICRVHTCAVLARFADKDRVYLLRELAGGYQTDHQKHHWDSEHPEHCSFCGQQDSREHRLLHCPVAQPARVPFTQLLHELSESGFDLPAFPVATMHPHFELSQSLQFKISIEQISDAASRWSRQRAAANHALHWYTDGSCQHPSSPMTRHSAYAVVLDMALSDHERESHARAFLRHGTVPPTLQTALVARTQGEQDILRAELQAIARVMLDIGYGFVHTDSQSAISMLTCTLQAAHIHDFAHLEHFDVLLPVWHARASIHVTLCKIKAHDDPALQPSLLESYHTLGNIHADAAASAASKHLLPELVRELEESHEQATQQMRLLHGVYELHLRVREARQRHLGHAGSTRHSSQPTPASVRQAFADWAVAAPLPALSPPCRDYLRHSAWGADLAHSFVHWLTLLIWPDHDHGPLQQPTGFSWTEMAVAFMVWWRRLLPVLRPAASSGDVVLFAHSLLEAKERGITLKELTNTAYRLLDHVQALCPDQLTPGVDRKRCTSLRTLGAKHVAMGWSRRPVVPLQDQMVDLLQTELASDTGQRLLTLPAFELDEGTLDILPQSFAERMAAATRVMPVVRRLRVRRD
eukprot:Skav207745  [mRNA]  locus=scaffold362:495056:499741:- [translate_table: standard]